MSTSLELSFPGRFIETETVAGKPSDPDALATPSRRVAVYILGNGASQPALLEQTFPQLTFVRLWVSQQRLLKTPQRRPPSFCRSPRATPT